MTDQAPQGEKIAKVLARAGLCSRREAERWVEAGRVEVDGKTVETPALRVTDITGILVDGKPLPEAEETRLWRYHKPTGLMTTHSDPEGRPTVFEKMPSDMPRVISVGRLDFNSEGLLLMTNNGELARALELPERGWTRRYRVRVHGAVDEEALRKLKRGIKVGDVKYGPIQAKLDQVQGSNAWLTVTLTEGKNREIRRVMEHIGLQVTRLIRIAYGPFQLGKLERGRVEEVPRRVLKEQLGRELRNKLFRKKKDQR